MQTNLGATVDHSQETRVFRIVYGLFGLLLLAWPMAAFVVMFIFDAPVQRFPEEALRYSVLAAIWLYPLFYFAGFLLSRRAKQYGRGVAAVLRPAILPLLPIAYVSILWTCAFVFDMVSMMAGS